MKKYFLILLLFGCSPSSDEKKTEDTSSQVITPIKKAEPNIDSLVQVTLHYPKVSQLLEDIENLSHDERTLKPTSTKDDDGTIWIKWMEDNGSNFVTHFHFHYFPKKKEMKILNIMTGEEISVEEWMEG